MPHHIIDLTSSPAGTPVPPRPPLLTAHPNAPAGKRLPLNDAPATERLPSNGTPTLTESEALDGEKKMPELRTVLRGLMFKRGQVAVDWIGDALLAREEAVKPFQRGDDDMGTSDLEISEGSDEASDEESENDEDADNDESEDEESDHKAPKGATTTANTSAGVKRLRSRYAHCVNCEEEFDATSNAPGVCVWHEGEMEVDWDGDFWADHDERCHGTIDDDSNRELYPEGFVWTCCEKGGEEEGCKVGRHRERPETVKRLKMTT